MPVAIGLSRTKLMMATRSVSDATWLAAAAPGNSSKLLREPIEPECSSRAPFSKEQPDRPSALNPGKPGSRPLKAYWSVEIPSIRKGKIRQLFRKDSEPQNLPCKLHESDLDRPLAKRPSSPTRAGQVDSEAEPPRCGPRSRDIRTGAPLRGEPARFERGCGLGADVLAGAQPESILALGLGNRSTKLLNSGTHARNSEVGSGEAPGTAPSECRSVQRILKFSYPQERILDL